MPNNAEDHLNDSRAHAPSTYRAPFLNPYEEIDIHEHHLPHWQQGEALCFVTWRLADAMPHEKLEQWAEDRVLWLQAHPRPWDSATTKAYYAAFSARLDAWLDAGLGECWLKDTILRDIVHNALHHFNGERYDLWSFVIMPNHVHALFNPRSSQHLKDILRSWKGYMAIEINRHLHRTGTVWQEGYWDRLIRHERHLRAALAYIRENPTKAKLAPYQFTLWEKSPGGEALGFW